MHYKIKILLMCILVLFANQLMAEESKRKVFNAKSYQSLTADKRAYRVGDTITIIVVENAQAGANAQTGASGGFNFSGKAFAEEHAGKAGLSLQAQNDGEASTGRSGFIRTQITVVVKSIDQIGHMSVAGQQSITINGEVQKISITGKIRSQDISANNTIPSYRVYGTSIVFDGKGVVTEGQDSGVLYKFFKWLGIV
ncbi:MAG: flagellar basal body L-ring protein FlgH [Alteromonadaceae bacterium]|nr:flagellar basal body L-ring protein FlgH [Alteromonadaceae bacterium]